MAQKAIELRKDYFTINTLAAAHAETGNFEEAIKIQETIVTLLKGSADTKGVVVAEDRLTCYKSHKPWQEPGALLLKSSADSKGVVVAKNRKGCYEVYTPGRAPIATGRHP